VRGRNEVRGQRALGADVAAGEAVPAAHAGLHLDPVGVGPFGARDGQIDRLDATGLQRTRKARKRLELGQLRRALQGGGLQRRNDFVERMHQGGVPCAAEPVHAGPVFLVKRAGRWLEGHAGVDQ